MREGTAKDNKPSQILFGQKPLVPVKVALAFLEYVGVLVLLVTIRCCHRSVT